MIQGIEQIHVTKFSTDTGSSIDDVQIVSTVVLLNENREF
jgi:hypothetical protein